jgi:hypothetical protein
MNKPNGPTLSRIFFLKYSISLILHSPSEVQRAPKATPARQIADYLFQKKKKETPITYLPFRPGSRQPYDILKPAGNALLLRQDNEAHAAACSLLRPSGLWL